MNRFDRELAMAQAHQCAVFRPRAGFQGIGHGRGLDAQRVITADDARRRQTSKEAAAIVFESTGVTVHRRSTHDAGAIVLSDHLQAQANPQDRHFSCEPLQRLVGCARIRRPAGARADDQAIGAQGCKRRQVQAFRAQEVNFRSERFEGLDEVPNERVAVVQYDEHRGILAIRAA